MGSDIELSLWIWYWYSSWCCSSY